MKAPKCLKLLIPSFLLFLSSLSAQTVATDPVGFMTLTVQPNSDITISASLSRSAVFSGIISSIDDSNTITVASNPGFTVNEYAPDDPDGRNSYYVQFTSGNKEGLWAIINANGTDSLDLTFVNEDLGSVANDRVEAGDSIDIIPFWTPATLFPDDEVLAGSELLMFSRNIAGTDISASATYVLYDGFGWYNGSSNVNDLPIYLDESFIFRNRSASQQDLTQLGKVPMNTFRAVLSLVTPGVMQDIRLTSGIPVDATLSEIFEPDALADGDQILFFNNNMGGLNNSSSVTAIYYDGFGWYNGSTNVDSKIILPGQGFVYRKSGSNTTDLKVSFTPSYQQ